MEKNGWLKIIVGTGVRNYLTRVMNIRAALAGENETRDQKQRGSLFHETRDWQP